MKIDTIKGQLEFYINAESKGKAFEDKHLKGDLNIVCSLLEEKASLQQTSNPE